MNTRLNEYSMKYRLEQFAPCFHCMQGIIDAYKDSRVVIYDIINNNDVNNDVVLLVFHRECFREIAGNEYMR